MRKPTTDWNTIITVLERLGAERSLGITHLYVDEERPLWALPLAKIPSAVQRMAQRYDGEIDDTIEAWSLGELLPECGWEATAWRRTRISTAHEFLLFLDPFNRYPRGSLFACNEWMSTETAVQWLLTDWWYGQGVVWMANWIKVISTEASDNTPSN